MPSLLSSRRLLLIAALVALFGARGLAQTPRPASLGETAAELSRISGTPITIHVTALLATDRSLPVACQALQDAFRVAASDPVTRERLPQIVHTVVLQGWFAGAEIHHVKLKDGVLTVETLTDKGDIVDVRPLVVEVLKKVAQMDARRRP